MLVEMLTGMGAVVLAKTNLPQSIMWLVLLLLLTFMSRCGGVVGC